MVFALDCEMIKATDGSQLAGHVVLVKSDLCSGSKKVLDTYIWHPEASILSYQTRYSRIHKWMIDEGVPLDSVVSFILRAIRGHTLVTFNGKADFSALGLGQATVLQYVEKHVELQDYFRRPNKQPYGLGPLVLHFGYQRNGRPIIVSHRCADDAFLTLRLYLDHYYHNDGEISPFFQPEKPILSNTEYKKKYRLY